jgi:anthranilate/para-aminobenzoate synthase component II
MMTTVEPGLPPLSPSWEEFRSLAERGNFVPIYAELAADHEAPLSAFLRLRPGRHRRFSLEDVQFHPESILSGQGKAVLKNFPALPRLRAA